MRFRARALTVTLGLTALLLLPFVALGEHEPDPTPTRTPTQPALAIALSPCSLSFWDYGLNGNIAAPSTNAVDPRALERIDLKYWDTGRVVTQADYAKGIDFKKLILTASLGGFRFDYDVPRKPAALPGARIGAIFDLPNRSSNVRNNYTGQDFEWDLGIQARWEGPGSWTVLGGAYLQERPIAGASVQESGNRISINLPLSSVRDLGLVQPGVRMLFGSYGPMPERVYDKFPDRGSIQLGLIEREAGTARSILQLDANGDRRNDIWFINATGGDAIQGIAFDRNNNGRIEFGLMEGPVLFRLGGVYLDLGREQHMTEGRRTRARLEGANLLYSIFAEDRNADGDLTDEGEHEGTLAPRGDPAFWEVF